MVGETISHYKILEKLGPGRHGGRVYGRERAALTRRLTNHRWALGFAFLLLVGWPGDAWTQEIVELGDRSANCHEDAACINRLHPAIPMAARAQPGATIVLHTRNATDFDLDPNAPPDPRDGDPGVGTVHSLTGPVHIEGAERG